MAALKTTENDSDVNEFLDGIKDDKKREEAYELLETMQRITKEKPKMWGSSIVGFGKMKYKYKSGREGEWMMIGFSPRKNSHSLYFMDSYEFKAHEKELEKLGKHKTSKGCLYINSLEDVDKDVLDELIKDSYQRVKGGSFLS